eukprot:6172782-Pleurochrysis_carterae.AAC.1
MAFGCVVPLLARPDETTPGTLKSGPHCASEGYLDITVYIIVIIYTTSCRYPRTKRKKSKGLERALYVHEYAHEVHRATSKPPSHSCRFEKWSIPRTLPKFRGNRPLRQLHVSWPPHAPSASRAASCLKSSAGGRLAFDSQGMLCRRVASSCKDQGSPRETSGRNARAVAPGAPQTSLRCSLRSLHGGAQQADRRQLRLLREARALGRADTAPATSAAVLTETKKTFAGMGRKRAF